MQRKNLIFFLVQQAKVEEKQISGYNENKNKLFIDFIFVLACNHEN